MGNACCNSDVAKEENYILKPIISKLSKETDLTDDVAPGSRSIIDSNQSFESEISTHKQIQEKPLQVPISLLQFSYKEGETGPSGREIMTITKPEMSAIYTGETIGNIPDGLGNLKSLDGSSEYTGEFKNGLFEGFGFTRISSKVYYLGEFKNGEMNGIGILYLPWGDIIRGKNIKGNFSSSAEYTWLDNSRSYFGPISEFRPNGEGIIPLNLGRIIWENLDVYKGGVRDGLRHGYGIMALAQDRQTWTGNWILDKLEGICKIESTKSVLIGEFYQGKKVYLIFLTISMGGSSGS